MRQQLFEPRPELDLVSHRVTVLDVLDVQRDLAAPVTLPRELRQRGRPPFREPVRGRPCE